MDAYRPRQASRSAFLALLIAHPLAAPAQHDGATALSHPLEEKALNEPDAVLAQLPPLIAAASQRPRERALLYLAQANACRVIADWGCQREAGAQASAAARSVKDAALEVRALVAEARAQMALQNYTQGERLLGAAEARLEKSPDAEQSAHIDLAWSSMSYSLGKHSLAEEYARRGLSRLVEDQAASLQVRLLRNLGRAQAQLGRFTEGKATLARALDLSVRVDDPKLRAELHLETARMARDMGDLETQRDSARQVLALGTQLRNSQLSGLAHEVLGLAAYDARDYDQARHELIEAGRRFRELGLVRDELRVSREAMDVMLGAGRPAQELEPVLRRYLALDRDIIQADRAQAADDFDARLKYAQQETQLLRLESEATLARERAAALAATNRLTRFITALAIGILLLLGVFVLLQRRANRRLRDALRNLRESESRSSELLRLSTGFVFMHDLHGRVLMMNPAAAQALGYAPDDVTGRDVRQFLPEEGRAAFDLYLQRVRLRGEAEGVLRVQRRDGELRYWRYGNRISAVDEGRDYVVGHAIDVTDQLAEADALRERSERDVLTGVWNRRHLDAFEHGLPPGTGWAVVNVDLDHFKIINDTHGHERGDRVLIEFAAFLQQRVRGHDAVVRTGGDEFLVLLAGAGSQALDALVQRLQSDAPQAPCGFSIGWALRDGDEPLAQTLARADAAMYERRRRTRGLPSAPP